MPRVLFVANHRLNRAPSQRFRFEQYLGYLKDQGIDWEFSPLLTEEEDRIFYGRSSGLVKVWVLARCAVRRARDVRRASEFDVVFIQREAFFGGWPVFERSFKRAGLRVVLDFDDSIWLLDVSEANRKYARLKRPQKTAEIAQLADLVIAGNSFLLEYAKGFNRNSILIPTTIDTNSYRRTTPRRTAGSICIGWTGSPTTIRNFECGVPALARVKSRFGGGVRFRVIGDGSYRNDSLGIQGEPWEPQSEVASLSDMDIGIMPLPDEDWSRGKCGLKGLQFMALETPVVMENLGANRDIVTDGVDGLLATGDDQWVEKLASLVESAALREKLAAAGRRTVEGRFSVESQKERYRQVLLDLLKVGR